MSWGTFQAAWAVLGRDVLITAALAFLARESRELVRDVSHHGRTSVGCAHRCSMSSQRLSQPGRERVLVIPFLSYGRTCHASRLCLCRSSGAVGPTGAYPGNRNTRARLHMMLTWCVSRSGHRVDVQRPSRNAGVEKFTSSNFKVTAYNK
jgi:hypothetical protein